VKELTLMSTLAETGVLSTIGIAAGVLIGRASIIIFSGDGDHGY